MAFTLILVGQLDDTKCSATFSGGMCIIHNPSGHTIATVPCTNSLYHVTAPEDTPTINYASIAMVKLTISKAHWKLGLAIAKGHITGIQLDPESKPEFCEVCARPKWLGNHSQRNQKLMQQNTESMSTGTCRDWLQSKASAETHMWWHA